QYLLEHFSISNNLYASVFNFFKYYSVWRAKGMRASDRVHDQIGINELIGWSFHGQEYLFF
ncbi:MAG: hypothetical protein MUP44_04810, partial [Anaerolineales bacterium]|nr:hypothetical protein [Anaerolineales bacterium]